MEQEKKYSAKEAAIAVLKKAEETLKKSELMKAESLKKQGQTLGAAIGFPGAPTTAPSAPVAKAEGPANNVQSQPAPNKNPAEIKENGNPAPGALPQNQDTYGAEHKDIKGHLKLAKFIGRMEAKRGSKAVPNG